jgi:hypothetical protein
MDKVILSIKRNASYEKGVYGLAVHDQIGGAGNVQPISTETELRQRLAGFGLTPSHIDSVVESLANKHDFIKLSVDSEKIATKGNA